MKKMIITMLLISSYLFSMQSIENIELKCKEGKSIEKPMEMKYVCIEGLEYIVFKQKGILSLTPHWVISGINQRIERCGGIVNYENMALEEVERKELEEAELLKRF